MRTLIIALVLMFSGCTTTEYVRIQPDCEVPPLPDLPRISNTELSPLTDTVRWKLEEREDLLFNWAEEMEGDLKTLCEGE